MSGHDRPEHAVSGAESAPCLDDREQNRRVKGSPSGTSPRHGATVRPQAEPPRVKRMLALAPNIDAMIGAGDFRDLADAARTTGVTRVHMTQIANLLLLAPEIQEAIVKLPLTTTGRDPISERRLRRIVAEADWQRQLELWNEVNQ